MEFHALGYSGWSASLPALLPGAPSLPALPHSSALPHSRRSLTPGAPSLPALPHSLALLPGAAPPPLLRHSPARLPASRLPASRRWSVTPPPACLPPGAALSLLPQIKQIKKNLYNSNFSQLNEYKNWKIAPLPHVPTKSRWLIKIFISSIYDRLKIGIYFHLFTSGFIYDWIRMEWNSTHLDIRNVIRLGAIHMVVCELYIQMELSTLLWIRFPFV